MNRRIDEEEEDGLSSRSGERDSGSNDLDSSVDLDNIFV